MDTRAGRVLLFTRVVAVVLNLKYVGTLFIVILFADAAALAALSVVPLPVINMMGGIQLSQSEQMISSTVMMVTTLGVLSAPIWILGALAAVITLRPDWRNVTQASTPVPENSAARGWLRPIAIWAIAVGLAALPFGQPPQALRYRAERDLKGGRIAEAIVLMSERERDQFPPHWDPPPRAGYRERNPEVTAVVKAILEQGSAEWVRQAYAAKLEQVVRERMLGFHRRSEWPQIAEDLRIDDEYTATRLQPAEAGLRQLLPVSPELSADDRTAIDSILAEISQSSFTAQGGG